MEAPHGTGIAERFVALCSLLVQPETGALISRTLWQNLYVHHTSHDNLPLVSMHHYDYRAVGPLGSTSRCHFLLILVPAATA